jgi:transcriptional regulator with XRE-family HTH domain
VSVPDRRRVARAFGIVLRTARMGANLSQHQLARAAHVSTNLPGLFERGRLQPTLHTVIVLADSLGMPASMLVSMTVGRLRREAASAVGHARRGDLEVE